MARFYMLTGKWADNGLSNGFIKWFDPLIYAAVHSSLSWTRSATFGVSTQLQSSGLVAHENNTFRNLAHAVSGSFMA